MADVTLCCFSNHEEFLCVPLCLSALWFKFGVSKSSVHFVTFDESPVTLFQFTFIIVNGNFSPQ